MRELLQRVAADLSALRAPFALVGGHAVSVRTEPRFTRDVFAVGECTRPQDRLDILALLRVASPDDLRTAERGIDRITERGAHRGRDLRAVFARLRSEAGR